MHDFNPSIQKDRQISEFKATLVYRMSSKIVRATQRNPVLKCVSHSPPKKKRKGRKGG